MAIQRAEATATTADRSCVTSQSPESSRDGQREQAEPQLTIQVEPAESVTITALVDNVTDLLASAPNVPTVD